MPPVRANKKNRKASEQLRNWLTKDKKAQCTPPVSFQLFSKTVENLQEIAFNIQCIEIDASGKTLDECAQWYYHTFYSDPTIRIKYEFELSPCPLAIKEKLLQLPSDAIGKEAALDERLQTLYETEVNFPKYGRFLFPVSFAKFEQYIDKENLLPYLVSKVSNDPSQHTAMLANETLCQNLLQKYYHSFYMCPNRRQLNKYKFNGVPAALQTHFLKPSEPLDELAKKNMPRSADQAVCAAETGITVASTTSTNSVSAIVSFCVFEKHIKNIYEIVWHLKLNNSNFAYKGFEDCAYAYYLAFYLTPEIRDRYAYELAPCTDAMRDQILAIPSKDEVQALQLLNPDHDLAESQEYDDVDAAPIEIPDEAAIEWDESSTKVCEVIEPQEQPSPMSCMESVGFAEITINEYELDVDEDHGMFEGSSCIEQTDKPLNALPVGYMLFKRYIKNLDEIVHQMLSCEEYKWKTEQECYLEYYKAFYTAPQIRYKFEYKLKPCPAMIRKKLLTLPAAVPEINPEPDHSTTESNSKSLVETVPNLETIEEESSEEVPIVEVPIVEGLIEERPIEEPPRKKTF